ncbi:uncharacterized protein F5147DRAFT_784915 [Suillus discolor]|uniref:DUF6532 domain-containing protein n=1 Tax=Suillus discolor TaxID=1912936 RepID=A0A9P7JKY7_9AGAM|nr:uncharacterized protein F5147DRAFT_784915 [Suillus discolor]KAG2079612.1 hypothetical protein F5147DRAFT_784915 [Suillus discolor]
MPPKKRARHSTNAQDDTAPCRQSSRSNRSVGGHAAQLQKAGEAVAARAKSRKGQNDYPELDVSDPEENSMAPVQLHRGKKSAPAKPPAAKNATKRKPASATPPTTSNNRSSQKSGNNVWVQGTHIYYQCYFPVYSPQMCWLLCDDLFTFHTEFKKVVVSIAKLSYDIFLKGTAMRPEEIKNSIAATATKLLKTGGYLRIPDSSNGKFKNFVSQALKDVCLEFFYSNSKKALKNTDDFRNTIPVNGLILVVAVMKGVISGFSETGTNKVPELSADRCRTDFDKLRKSVDKLLDIPELCEELEEMLEQWAKIGMGEFDWHGVMQAVTRGDINIIL